MEEGGDDGVALSYSFRPDLLCPFLRSHVCAVTSEAATHEEKAIHEKSTMSPLRKFGNLNGQQKLQILRFQMGHKVRINAVINYNFIKGRKRVRRSRIRKMILVSFL